MNVYLVKLTIHCGEYEKTNQVLVRASSHSIAGNYAIYSESHDPANLDWSENRVVDMFGEFAYGASTVKVCSSDVAALSKYLRIFTADVSELLQSGNFQEHCYVKPLGAPRTLKEVCLANAAAMFVKGNQNGHYANYLYLKNHNSNEIPQGMELRSDRGQLFLVTEKEQLLSLITEVAKELENSANTLFELTQRGLRKDAPEISLDLKELYLKELFNQWGLIYPDDAAF